MRAKHAVLWELWCTYLSIEHKEAINVRLEVDHDPIIALARVQDRRCAEALRVVLAVFFGMRRVS